MSRLSEQTLCAFRDELRKEAGFGSFVAKNKGVLQNVGGLAGVGALGGGAIGGLRGGVKGYQEARSEGSGIGGAALHGLASGLGGAVSGAGAGALVGGVAGAAGGSAGRLNTRSDALGSAARFGQRQVHSVTGMLSPQELEGIRGGAYTARKGLSNARANVGTLTGKLRTGDATNAQVAKAQAGVGKAQRGLASQEAATGVNDPTMNLTSIPGYLGSMKAHGVGKTLLTSAKEQYHTMPTAMGAAMVGMPLLGAARTAVSPESPEGAGKGERLGRDIGNAVGGVAGGVMPVVGNALVGGAAGAAGGVVGRVADRIRGRMKGPADDLGTKAPLEPMDSQNTPTERVMSPSAAGQQKDVGL